MVRPGALALLFILAVRAFADDAGLLLGVREMDGRLSTVWVTRRGVATFVRKLPRGISFVREREVWRFEESKGAVLMREPNGKLTVVNTSGTQHDEIGYVVEGLIGLRNDQGRLRTVEWPQLGHSMSLMEAMGEVNNANFIKAMGPEAMVQDWTLHRSSGDWWIARTIFPTGTRPHATTVVKASADWAVADRDAVKWESIVRAYNDASDFTANSKTDIAAVVTKEGVFVHRASKDSLLNRLQRVSLDVESVISVQWIEARDLDKVSRALQRKEPKAN